MNSAGYRCGTIIPYTFATAFGLHRPIEAKKRISGIRRRLSSRGGTSMANIARQQARDAHVLLREDQGPVAVLTLNRPEARNSLSEEMIGAVTSAIKEIGGSDAVRAIVITGSGT